MLPLDYLLRIFNRQLSILLLTAVFVAGCSGDSEPKSANSDQSESTTDALQTSPARNLEQTEDPTAQTSTADLPYPKNRYYREREYSDYVKLPLQFIPTQGGKKLSVRVALPANEQGEIAAGPFPTIVVQSAYNTNLLSSLFFEMPGFGLLGVTDPFLVERGYALVSVDALGTGASEGGWELLGPQEQEGFGDVIDWVEKQSWNNGRIGVAGVSYMAISALFAAQKRPDSIDAVFASLPLGDAYRGTVGTGGLLNALFMTYWMRITQVLSTLNIFTQWGHPEYADQLRETTQEHADQIDHFYLPMINSALDNAPKYNYDNEFWRVRSPIENIDQIKAPTIILGALDDIFQRDEPLLYEALKKNGVDTRLVIYDGTHIENFLLPHFPKGEVPSQDYLLLQWFDHYLRDMDTNIEQIPPVTQHIKNYPSKETPKNFSNDSFSMSSDWPHPKATPERWYLHDDGMLTQSAPMTISNPSSTTNTGTDNSEDAESSNQEFRNRELANPKHPNGYAYRNGDYLTFQLEINDGSECSRSFEQWVLGLAFPQPCFRNNASSAQTRAIYQSSPMSADYYINGPIQADLWISSTATEAVIAIQVEEVSSEGIHPITGGQLLASARAVDLERSRFINNTMVQPYHHFTEAENQPLTPNDIVKLQVEIFPTSALIRKGNRLRITLNPSNQAQGMLNFPKQEQAEGGVTTVYTEPSYPSSIVLPIVPLSELN